MKQTISLSPYSVGIDSGMVLFNLSAWLGCVADYLDTAEVILSFLNGMSEAIGNLTTIGPVWGVDRNYTTMFLFRQNSGLVPIGARYMTATVINTFNHPTGGAPNTAISDNIAVVLSHV